MTTRTLTPSPNLRHHDETAWLEAMAELARNGRIERLDLPGIAEYLSDMAARDRREVESRLVVLMMHLLKWDSQPAQRSRSWRATVIEQRQELSRLSGRGVLHNHAEAVLAETFVEAVERAVAETGLAIDQFPSSCPYTLAQLLVIELPIADASHEGTDVEPQD